LQFNERVNAVISIEIKSGANQCESGCESVQIRVQVDASRCESMQVGENRCV